MIKKIKVVDKEFEIKPFVVKTRSKFLGIVFDIFYDSLARKVDLGLGGPGKRDITTELKMVPIFIEIAGERLIDIYQLVLDAPKEWMEENIQLKDEIIIIRAIMEVNETSFLISQFKNVAEQVKVRHRQ